MNIPQNISLTERATGRIIYLYLQKNLTPDHWYVSKSAPRLELKKSVNGTIFIYKETGMTYEPYTNTPTTDEGELVILIFPDNQQAVYEVNFIDYPKFNKNAFTVNIDPK